MLCHKTPVTSQRPVSILCLQPRTSFGPPSNAWTRKHHTWPAARRHAANQQHALSITCAQKQQFSSFDDMVQNSELPVLVDFYATWCGPCQVMSQTLSVWAAHFSDTGTGPSYLNSSKLSETPIAVQKVSTQMAGKIKFVKIDTDKYPKVASRYAIQALPTLLVFRDGKQVDRIEGNDAGRMCMNAQLLADRLQYLLFSSTST